MNKVNIGKNLVILCKRHGFTQARLAEAVDVTTDHIDHVENGYNGLSLLRLLKICDVLEATPNDILAGKYNLPKAKDSSTLSLDFLKLSDIDLIYAISYFLKNKNMLAGFSR